MKQAFSVLLGTLLCVSAFASGSRAAASAPSSPYHIGIVTGTQAQSKDTLRGAQELIRRYGSVEDGGLIAHRTYPEKFMQEQETLIQETLSLADDPLMKAIIINQGVPGTAEAFRQIKARRPDILLFAGDAHEDPLVIANEATLAVRLDFISRGYTIPWAAKQLGADTFVHISFPRHLSYESISLRRTVFEAACKDLGLKFAAVNAPDPLTEAGIKGAQAYIVEHTPQWISLYGTKAAFFCTNDAHTEPLLAQLLIYGGIFVEADLPSPLIGYPGALDLSVSTKSESFPELLKKVEAAIVSKGGAGKFGTWAFSYGYTVSAGLGEFAKRILDGTAKADSLSDLYDSLGEFTPGAKWNGSYYIDASTGIRTRNQILIYMDTYVLGQGFLPTTGQVIPQKYYNLQFN
ncbi:DUF3798 domain-containing protein [Breznakiellaceae bacterium SP9]